MNVLLTHLSDYSYIDRGVYELFAWMWIVHRIAVHGGWKEFTLSNLKSFKSKTICTLCVFISLTLMIPYDAIAAKFKYEQGFSLVDGKCKTGIISEYTKENLVLVDVTGMILNFAYTFKNSATFLLLATFSHIGGKLSGSKFMSSGEFKSYTIWAVISICVYPILQVSFTDPLLSVLAPQLFYSLEAFVLCILLLYTNKRLKKLTFRTNSVIPARPAKQDRNIAETQQIVSYYVYMNKVLCLFIFGDAFTLGVLNIDILSSKQIATNKFATDLMTKLLNCCFPTIYIVITLILYPSFIQLNTRTSKRKKNKESSAIKDSTTHGTASKDGPSRIDENPVSIQLEDE